MPSSYVPSSVLGTTIEPSEMTLGTGVGSGILSRPLFATTATAAGTTTLTVTSAQTQEFTGSTTQDVIMPVVTTLVAGWSTTIINKSTGIVTARSSGVNGIDEVPAGETKTFVCRSISADTTAAAWDVVGLSPRLWVAAKKNATQTLADGATDVATPFQTILGGTMQGAWNTTTGEFTAPKTGLVKISGAARGMTSSTGTVQDGWYELVVKNGGTVLARLVETTPEFNDSSAYSTLNENPNTCIAVTAGDVLAVVSSWSIGTSIDFDLSQECQIQIEYL